MSSKIPMSREPFWLDHHIEMQPNTGLLNLSTCFMKLASFFIMVTFLLTLGLLFAPISPFLSTLYFLSLLALLAYWYSQQRRRKLGESKIIETQEKASGQLQASFIGSAVHVAGHPQLGRNQPVVVALTEKQLLILTYNGPPPIDSLPVSSIQSIETIVYDDERVPHNDVIDPAAQALQLSFTRDGKQWMCLFNHFRKSRAIDWYHAIQQARA